VDAVFGNQHGLDEGGGGDVMGSEYRHRYRVDQSAG
jgi:hypothetical protein